MKKPVCTIKFIRSEISKRGYDAKTLYFPRGYDFLLFKTFERFEKDDKYFILDKYDLSLKMISKDDYLSYIDEIDNCKEMAFNLYRLF